MKNNKRILEVNPLKYPCLLDGGISSEKLRAKFKKAGFDLDKGYGVFKGINTISYIFTQKK